MTLLKHPLGSLWMSERGSRSPISTRQLQGTNAFVNHPSIVVSSGNFGIDSDGSLCCPVAAPPTVRVWHRDAPIERPSTGTNCDHLQRKHIHYLARHRSLGLAPFRCREQQNTILAAQTVINKLVFLHCALALGVTSLRVVRSGKGCKAPNPPNIPGVNLPCCRSS